jgi:Tfp pilus assembly protein PilN
MRAVNLIPTDERRGAGGAGGRSGGFAYVVLGALAVGLVMLTAYTLTTRSLHKREGQLASVQAQAQAEQAKASQLSSYTQFAALRAKRVQTVTSLAGSRFDWAHVIHEVARVLPRNVWLTSVIGTVTPSVSVSGGGAGGGGIRGALPVPALQLSGCTTDTPSVSRVLARLRLMDGIQRVSLVSSRKGEATGGGDGSGDCRNGSDRFPQFDVVAFFAAPPAAAAPAAVTAGSTTPVAASGGAK